MAEPARRVMTYDEYLAMEEASGEKHELIRGEPRAMSGGTPRHAQIQAALAYCLRAALGTYPCRAFGSDLRLYFPDLGETAYADAVVVCGPIIPPAADANAVTNPTVVCEVLSPSTEAYDRGDKFEKYRGLASVQEYVLLAQDRARVEVYRRADDGAWTLRSYGPGERAPLASVDAALDVDTLYDGVLDPPAPPPTDAPAEG